MEGTHVMDAGKLGQLIRLHLGLRVSPETSRYIERMLATNAKSPFFVLAANARTGVAVRAQIDPQSPIFRSIAPPQPQDIELVKPSKPNEQLMLF
jgi:hypothetical protein